jgi:hypothetical protein
VNNPEALDNPETLDDASEPVARLGAAIDGLRAEVDVLRSELARLDSDLTESRKLNLRAAELLDLAYARIGGQG